MYSLNIFLYFGYSFKHHSIPCQFSFIVVNHQYIIRIEKVGIEDTKY